MTQLKDNPLYEAWTEEDQRIFLRDAIQWTKYKGAGNDTLQWLYRTGRIWGVLKIDYEQFCSVIYSGHVRDPNRRRRFRFRFGPEPGPYREGTKYRKNVDHKKKEKTQKQIWREYKHNREKRKSYWRMVAPKWYRRKEKKRERAHIRQLIAHGEWEALESVREKDTWW